MALVHACGEEDAAVQQGRHINVHQQRAPLPRARHKELHDEGAQGGGHSQKCSTARGPPRRRTPRSHCCRHDTGCQLGPPARLEG